MRITSKPSSLHFSDISAEKRLPSLPDRVLAATNALVIALALSLAPLTLAVAADITFSSQYEISWSGITENGPVGYSLCSPVAGGLFCEPPKSTPEFSLPQFNPALGTLTGVDFVANMTLQGDVAAAQNCKGAFGCAAFPNYTDTTTLHASATIDLAVPGFNFGPNLSVSLDPSDGTQGAATVACLTGTVLLPLPTPDCPQEASPQNSKSTSHVFTGTNLSRFIGTGEIDFPFVAPSGTNDFQQPFFTNLSETDNSGFETHPPPDSGVQESGFCDDAASCAIEIALGYYESGGFKGDCCFGLAGVAALGKLNITYTYNPASAAVPEPTTLALLGLGLFGVGLSRRRLAR